MADLNREIKPHLSAIYDRSASLFSTRGHQIVDRAMKKGTVGGEVGMQLLFEPAMLLSLTEQRDAMHELATIAKNIPFIGNYNQWLPASATIAAAYRGLTLGADPRAAEVQQWLSLPGHGGGTEAMTNRLNGLVVEQIRSDTYAPPLKLPQFSYAVAKLRELSVMWAFGGTEAWPRERIDDAIAVVNDQVADFLAPNT
ncbi:hypothetical protein H7J08_00770 [Mycobacterium frederiksbergense]|uniref:hypothetical protein n=1 Tax=Mycolicibacterium frederiksbergense TaxID=117567 RepID=UPI0021F276F2|nr:hypothetical protein [Mycolicibacterium frederiksbergense]MCV7043210.1 hypothetical protein [Mycolicibacterium frederiksbergense]